uniref:CFA20 domain-containing protein n=1 Tax=Mycena chlorophos TaxID=658473 RepID=A0ABQ0M7P2_MYCCL|nr:predicted protein [Mycena chlorophos]
MYSNNTSRNSTRCRFRRRTPRPVSLADGASHAIADAAHNIHPLSIQQSVYPWEWSFEVGLVDRLGGTGIVRVSTFQKEPRLTPSTPALLHLPLSFPSIWSQRLTTWTTVTLNLPSLLPHFSSPSMYPHGSDFSPAPALGVFSHVSFVKVYATCRLRRIWFNQGGPSKEPPWEFELYGDEYR